MQKFISVPANNFSFPLAAEGPAAVGILEDLANLLGLSIATSFNPVCGALLLRSPGEGSVDSHSAVRFRTGGIHYSSDGSDPAVLQLENSSSCERHAYRILYMRLLLTAGYVRAMLDSCGSFCLMHGVFLEQQGEGVLFFGASGIGKSTSMRRWKSESGEGCADDLILLCRTENGFFCRPLPTWSACIAKKEEKHFYPVGNAIPLRGLFWLTRSDAEERIEPAPGAFWKGQILSALTLHLYDPMRILVPEDKKRIGECNRQMMEDLERIFSRRTLRASLDGKLKKTLNSCFSQTI